MQLFRLPYLACINFLSTPFRNTFRSDNDQYHLVNFSVGQKIKSVKKKKEQTFLALNFHDFQMFPARLYL